MSLAALYEFDSSYTKAIEVYSELNKKQPTNLIVINNLASMLSDYGDNNKDLELAKELAVKLEATDQPVFLDTVGWIYYKSGDSKKAVELLTKVVEKAADINVFNYHLGMAYKLAGDNANAKIYLAKSLADKRPFKQKKLAEAALKDL